MFSSRGARERARSRPKRRSTLLSRLLLSRVTAVAMLYVSIVIRAV